MQFNLCENTGFFLRMGLVGPSGSGKTYTALKVATELGYQKVGILDTENRSARRYARSFARRFLALELDRFSPRDYIEGIQAAVAAGLEVLIIDSLSHAWMGKGGVLEMVDQSAKRQAKGGAANSFNGWREVTPEHNKLVEALVHAPLHLIVTMRVKTEYVVEEDARGKKVPRKVGLAPVQREGLEYEFDIVGEMSPEHELCVTKTRLSELADQVLGKPGTELARTIRAWLDGAGPAPVPASAQASTTLPVPPTVASPGAAGVAQRPDPAADPDADADWRGRRCDGCGAPVVLVASPDGRPWLVETQRRDRPDLVVDEREVYDLRIHTPHTPGCPARRQDAQPQPPRKPDPIQAQALIVPWLEKVDGCKTTEALQAVRAELTAALPADQRTRAQGETLRRAVAAAEARIRATLRDATQTALPGTATAGPPSPRELRIERDPQDPDGYTANDDQPIGLVPTDHP